MGGRRRRQPRGLGRSPGFLGPWVTRCPGAWWGGWRRPEEWGLSECVWSSASPMSCPLQAPGLLPQDRGWAPAAFIAHQGECSGQSTYHTASHPGFGLSLPQERETLGQEPCLLHLQSQGGGPCRHREQGQIVRTRRHGGRQASEKDFTRAGGHPFPPWTYIHLHLPPNLRLPIR